MKKLFLLGAMVCALGMMTACKSGTADKNTNDTTTTSEQLAETNATIPTRIEILRTDGKGFLYGLMNENGDTILPVEYDAIGFFYEGMVIVRKDDLPHPFGFVNTKGELVIPCKWDMADDFKDGRAYVELGDSSFFINMQGEIISTETGDYDIDFGQEE